MSFPAGHSRRSDPSIVIIRAVITVTDRGRTDSKVVGDAVANMTCVEGEQGRDQAYELGEGVSQYDSRSRSKISAISDAHSHYIQEHALTPSIVLHLLTRTFPSQWSGHQ